MINIKKFSHIFPFLKGALQSVGKPKVFCVGRNNTGLASMREAFIQLGLVVGNKKFGELLLHDWGRRNFRRLYILCLTAQAFHDAPFSYPFTFIALDQKFPRSKFILTVRDDPEAWYQAKIEFHKEFFGDGQLPSWEDLKAENYIYKGRMSDAIRLRFVIPDNDPYNKEILIADYISHNKAVIEYFRHRPNDLLVLNVGHPDAMDSLCDFLGKPRIGWKFPQDN